MFTQPTPDLFAAMNQQLIAAPAFTDNSKSIVEAFKGLDEMTMAALDAAGSLIAKSVTAIAGKTMDTAVSATAGVASAAPYVPGFSASSSPMGESANSQRVGNERVLSHSGVGTDQHGHEIGNLSPSAVGAGAMQGQSYTR